MVDMTVVYVQTYIATVNFHIVSNTTKNEVLLVIEWNKKNIYILKEFLLIK